MPNVDQEWEAFRATLHSMQKAAALREQLNVISAQLNNIEQDTKSIQDLKNELLGDKQAEAAIEQDPTLAPQPQPPMPGMPPGMPADPGMMGGASQEMPMDPGMGGGMPPGTMKADLTDGAEPSVGAVGLSTGVGKVQALFNQLIDALSEEAHTSLDSGDIARLMKLTNVQSNLTSLLNEVLPLAASLPQNEMGGGEPIAKSLRLRKSQGEDAGFSSILELLRTLKTKFNNRSVPFDESSGMRQQITFEDILKNRTSREDMFALRDRAYRGELSEDDQRRINNEAKSGEVSRSDTAPFSNVRIYDNGRGKKDKDGNKISQYGGRLKSTGQARYGDIELTDLPAVYQIANLLFPGEYRRLMSKPGAEDLALTQHIAADILNKYRGADWIQPDQISPEMQRYVSQRIMDAMDELVLGENASTSSASSGTSGMQVANSGKSGGQLRQNEYRQAEKVSANLGGVLSGKYGDTEEMIADIERARTAKRHASRQLKHSRKRKKGRRLVDPGKVVDTVTYNKAFTDAIQEQGRAQDRLRSHYDGMLQDVQGLLNALPQLYSLMGPTVAGTEFLEHTLKFGEGEVPSRSVSRYLPKIGWMPMPEKLYQSIAPPWDPSGHKWSEWNEDTVPDWIKDSRYGKRNLPFGHPMAKETMKLVSPEFLKLLENLATEFEYTDEKGNTSKIAPIKIVNHGEVVKRPKPAPHKTVVDGRPIIRKPAGPETDGYYLLDEEGYPIEIDAKNPYVMEHGPTKLNYKRISRMRPVNYDTKQRKQKLHAVEILPGVGFNGGPVNLSKESFAVDDVQDVAFAILWPELNAKQKAIANVYIRAAKERDKAAKAGNKVPRGSALEWFVKDLPYIEPATITLGDFDEHTRKGLGAADVDARNFDLNMANMFAKDRFSFGTGKPLFVQTSMMSRPTTFESIIDPEVLYSKFGDVPEELEADAQSYMDSAVRDRKDQMNQDFWEKMDRSKIGQANFYTGSDPSKIQGDPTEEEIRDAVEDFFRSKTIQDFRALMPDGASLSHDQKQYLEKMIGKAISEYYDSTDPEYWKKQFPNMHNLADAGLGSAKLKYKRMGVPTFESMKADRDYAASPVAAPPSAGEEFEAMGAPTSEDMEKEINDYITNMITQEANVYGGKLNEKQKKDMDQKINKTIADFWNLDNPSYWESQFSGDPKRAKAEQEKTRELFRIKGVPTPESIVDRFMEDRIRTQAKHKFMSDHFNYTTDDVDRHALRNALYTAAVQGHIMSKDNKSLQDYITRAVETYINETTANRGGIDVEANLEKYRKMGYPEPEDIDVNKYVAQRATDDFLDDAEAMYRELMEDKGYADALKGSKMFVTDKKDKWTLNKMLEDMHDGVKPKIYRGRSASRNVKDLEPVTNSADLTDNQMHGAVEVPETAEIEVADIVPVEFNPVDGSVTEEVKIGDSGVNPSARSISNPFVGKKRWF